MDLNHRNNIPSLLPYSVSLKEVSGPMPIQGERIAQSVRTRKGRFGDFGNLSTTDGKGFNMLL